MKLTETQKNFRKEMEKLKPKYNDNPSYKDHSRTVKFENYSKKAWHPFTKVLIWIFFMFILPMVIKTFKLPINNTINTNSLNQLNTNKPITTDKNSTIVPYPKNGHETKYTTKEFIADLKITSPADDNFYFIRFKNSTTNETEYEVFIYPNSTIETKIPLGRYIMQYTCGRKWYGNQNLFGFQGQIYQSETILNFNIENNQIMGKHIILKSVTGNMPTKPINKNEFNK